MKDKSQNKSSCEKSKKKTQPAEKNDEIENAEEEAAGEDLGLIAEIIPEEFARQMLKKNEAALNAINLFISNKYISRVFLDCEDGFLRRVFLEAFRGAANIIDAANVGEVEDAFRNAALLCFEPSVLIFEGEVVDIRSIKDNNNEVQEVELTLRAAKGTKVVRLSRYMRNAISNLNVGDVVYIEPNAGLIKRLGRSESCANEYDLEGDKYVQLNKGSVSLRKKRSVFVSFYDFDYAFNKYSSDISIFTRSAVNAIVSDYLESGMAKTINSVLVINNSELLEGAQLKVLKRCMEAQPWVKVMLVGSLNKMDRADLASFLRIETSPEDPMDVLRARHGNLANFAGVIEKYINKVSLEKISDALFASENTDDLACLLNSQI